MQNKSVAFLIYSGAIFTFFFLFGIFQEKVTRSKYAQPIYDDEGNLVRTEEETFTYSMSLVFVMCCVNYLFAKVNVSRSNLPEDKTPTKYYISVGVTYLLAMVCSNMALQWVSYPTQVIGKSAKPIAVLFLGVLVGRKSYPLKKYFFIILIVAGVLLFMYKDQKSTDQDLSFGIGELLIILSLTMDGLTGAVQERMKAETKPSAYQMMHKTNMWSCLLLGTAIIATGEIRYFAEFVMRYPNVLAYIALLSLAGALGQTFIYFMIQEFGPLPCSVITTTRKFFTVLFSVLFFGNSLTQRQWLGAVIVFLGLFLDTFYSKGQPKKTQSK